MGILKKINPFIVYVYCRINAAAAPISLLPFTRLLLVQVILHPVPANFPISSLKHRQTNKLRKNLEGLQEGERLALPSVSFHVTVPYLPSGLFSDS